MTPWAPGCPALRGAPRQPERRCRPAIRAAGGWQCPPREGNSTASQPSPRVGLVALRSVPDRWAQGPGFLRRDRGTPHLNRRGRDKVGGRIDDRGIGSQGGRGPAHSRPGGQVDGPRRPRPGELDDQLMRREVVCGGNAHGTLGRPAARAKAASRAAAAVGRLRFIWILRACSPAFERALPLTLARQRSCSEYSRMDASGRDRNSRRAEMALAIERAREAAGRGDVPIGAASLAARRRSVRPATSASCARPHGPRRAPRDPRRGRGAGRLAPPRHDPLRDP